MKQGFNHNRFAILVGILSILVVQWAVQQSAQTETPIRIVPILGQLLLYLGIYYGVVFGLQRVFAGMYRRVSELVWENPIATAIYLGLVHLGAAIVIACHH